MSKKKEEQLTRVQKEYQKFAKEREPKRPVLKDCLKAFIVGGAICAFGQILQLAFIKYFGFTEKTAGNPAAAVITFGVFSAFIVSLIKMCLIWLGSEIIEKQN